MDHTRSYHPDYYSSSSDEGCRSVLTFWLEKTMMWMILWYC